MKELYNIEIDEENIKNMLEIYPEIKGLDDNDIIRNINILKDLNCNDSQIRNILISNPFYLDRNIEDINNLIKFLIKIGLNNLNLLFDSNPYLLNKDTYEINENKEKELKKEKNIDDIIDELEINPFIIDE